MKKMTIAVSGLNAADNPGPGIGVARSLKKDPDLAETRMREHLDFVQSRVREITTREGIGNKNHGSNETGTDG